MTGSPCLGADLELDSGGCVAAHGANTAHGPITYDSSKRPVLLTSPAWPYACPMQDANGLKKDPALGLWTNQQMLRHFYGYEFTTFGSPVAMARDAWTLNGSGGTFTFTNPLCVPLQLIVSVSMRMQITLTHKSFVICTAWMGRASLQPSTSGAYYPQFKSVHFDDTLGGSVPYVLPLTLTRRVSMAANETLTINARQWLYYNYFGAASYANYPGTSPYSTGSVTGPTGAVNSESIEWGITGWPSLSPVDDQFFISGGSPPRGPSGPILVG